MKANLMLMLFLIVATSVCAQEEINNTLRQSNDPIQSSQIQTVERTNHTETKEIYKNKSVTISKRPGEPQRVHNQAYYQEEIDKVNQHIAAIDQKVAHVNADPVEKQNAIDSGWFDQMESNKNTLIEKRNVLQTKMDNL